MFCVKTVSSLPSQGRRNPGTGSMTILMLRIIPSRLITAQSCVMINVIRKSGPMIKIFNFYSKYRQSNVSMTPTQIHVDGCGFITRQDMETDVLITEELPTEPAQNDMNEIIDESDIVIAGFKPLEN